VEVFGYKVVAGELGYGAFAQFTVVRLGREF
jgi:hypothetical protein